MDADQYEKHIVALTTERDKLIGLLKEVEAEVDMWALGIDLKGRIQAAIAGKEQK